MTVTEIQTLAESYLDDDIDDADALLWMNDFLDEPELVEVFRYTATQTLVVTSDDTWYDRTVGHLAIVEIVDSEEDKYTGDFELNHDRDEIRGLPADTYTITSITVPTAVTAVGNTPVVNTVFHRAAAVYMAGKFKCKDNDQNPDGLRLIAQGMSKARSATRLLKDQDRREQQKVKRSTWA